MINPRNLHGSIIAFQSNYLLLGINVHACLFLSQSVYWMERTHRKDGFYKTMEEWFFETGLTRAQQESSRKTLKKMGILIESKKGIPAKLYFKINYENLNDLLLSAPSRKPLIKPKEKTEKPNAGIIQTVENKGLEPSSSSMYDSSIQCCINRADSAAQIAQTKTTETTTETTTEITKPLVGKNSDDNSEDVRFAFWMYETIKNDLPDFKEPNIEKWAKSIGKMRKYDKRNHHDMAIVWKWSRNDPFWQTNILCPISFRKQFDKLKAKFMQATASQPALDRAQTTITDDSNKDWAKGIGRSMFEPLSPAPFVDEKILDLEKKQDRGWAL